MNFRLWLSYFKTAIGEVFSLSFLFWDINLCNVVVFCKLRRLWCCHCWGLISFFQCHCLFWCHADWFVYFPCIPNRTLKSFSIFHGLSSDFRLFSSSWQDSAPPVPALVGTWQPQWKAAGRMVLKNEVNNLSEHLWPSSLFKSEAPLPSLYQFHLIVFFLHPPTLT